MAKSQVLEGTWDEIAAHADELRRYPNLRLIIPSEEQTVVPNEGMLEVLREIEKRQEGRRYTAGEDTDRMLREARAGGMYGLDPTE